MLAALLAYFAVAVGCIVVYLGRHGNWHPVLSNRFVLVQPMPHLSHADDCWLTGVCMLRTMVSIIAVVGIMTQKRISGCECYLFHFCSV